MTHRLLVLLAHSAAWFGVPLGLLIAAAPFLPGYAIGPDQLFAALGFDVMEQMLVPLGLHTAIALSCNMAPTLCLEVTNVLNLPGALSAIALWLVVTPAICLGLAGTTLDRRFGRDVAPNDLTEDSIQGLRLAGVCLVVGVGFGVFWSLPLVLTAWHLGWMSLPELSLGAGSLILIAAVPLAAMSGGARLGLGLLRLSSPSSGALVIPPTGQHDRSYEGLADQTLREPGRNPGEHRPAPAATSRPM